ncbi:MAG TPA: UvrD-helicase domain-containing protein, partial [Gammaproteobacteria bacterium]|nr:UvrD-helicase domain-containing protein [Gammaproteobacteria bacterium]
MNFQTLAGEPRDVQDILNPAQHAAVTAEARQLRVLAGAGSGKTRVLVQRIAWLVQRYQMNVHRILAVTFTNKAANEMRRRIESLLGFSAKPMWIGTFHGLAHRVLRQEYRAADLPDNFQIIDSDDQTRLIKQLIIELGWTEEDCEPKRTAGFINRQKDEGVRARALGPASSPEYERMIEIYRRYETHCLRLGLVDFAELLLKVYECWQQHPDILSHYQNRFQHILVDEFQDTNTIQYRWLMQLSGKEGAITVVGDDDQSIYGWRGARIENIHRFSQDFPKAETIRLEQNYRSTSTILSAANALITHNEARLGKNLWTQGAAGEKISLYGAFNELDEARFIVDRIQEWLRHGGACRDIAVLYRANAQSRVIEQALRSYSIPYRVYGGLRFFDRAEIKDILGYLRLLVNVNDEPAFDRVVNMPPRGIGERTLTKIRENAKEKQISLWAAAKQTLESMPAGRIASGLGQFVEIIETHIKMMSTSVVSEVVESLLKKTGLPEYFMKQPGDRAHGRIENLKELVFATKEFSNLLAEEEALASPLAEKVLPAFISQVALDAGDRENPEDDNCVNLMTLHSAKGLEFPVGFVSGLEEGLFPHRRCIDSADLLEEERRLCYVGMTRAMSKLYMTYAEKRAFAGIGGVNRPSRFISEIPSDCMEAINLNFY